MQLRLILFLLSLLLAACAPTETPVPPTATFTLPPPTLTPMPEATPILATPLPTQPPFAPFMTPDAIQVERWQEYQTELAKMFLSEGGVVPYEHSAGSIICEWDILGRSGQEVYVWAICTHLIGDGGGGGRPAVIHLDLDGSIEKVEVVPYGNAFDLHIQRMFPVDVQEKIDDYLQSYEILPILSGKAFDLGTHLIWRQEHPEEPPLIVLLATPVP